MSKVIVIGGGAAGMMAAIAAGMCGHQVDLLEKNEKLGKKIYITGKGRCNFTNASSLEEIFGQIVTNQKFMYSALYTFSNESVMDYFESHGMEYKIERGNRVFPVSDHASDVTAALQKGLKENHVKVHLHTKVTSVNATEGKVTGVILDDHTMMQADAVIIATGGCSYQTTGSTGDGYTFARQLQHQVTDVRPALVPLTTKESYIYEMQGLSLKNVTLRIFDQKNKKIYQDFGEMMFTHFGITGPLVLSASSKVGKILAKEGTLRGEIDLKPAVSEEELDIRLQKNISENLNKQYKHLYSKLLPSKMIPVMMQLSNVSEDKKLNEITKEERMYIIQLMKHFPFVINGTREFKEAIVTQGGVNVKEINPSTMESKKVKGLYFAGEVLDVDALTGGYNLQVAFSTGYLAGISVEA